MIIVFANSPCASISTMEFEPGMVSDVKQAIGKLMPNGDDNRYGRGMPNVAAHNSHSNGHATSNLNGSANGHASVGDPMQSLIGPGITLPFKDNRLMLGKWQEIVLLDFSKAKGRMKVTLQIMGEELQHFE
jgi:thiamine phosphate synthase YjbQ (UPF0047 family)